MSVGHIRQSAVQVTPFELLPAAYRCGPPSPTSRRSRPSSGRNSHDEFRLNYVLRFSDSAYLDQADGGFPYVPLPYRNLNDQQQLIMRGEAEWTPVPGFHNVFGANYSKFDRLFAGPLDPLAPPTPTTYLGERTRFDYRGDWQVSPGNLVLFGAQREDERFETTGIDRSNGNSAGFAELQTTPFAGAALVANIRHDSNDSSAARHLSGGAELHRARHRHPPEGSVGTGFKPPTLSQLYGLSGLPLLREPEPTAGKASGSTAASSSRCSTGS